MTLPNGDRASVGEDGSPEIEVTGGLITFPPNVPLSEAQIEALRAAFNRITGEPAGPISYEDVVFTRRLGHPISVDTAPRHTKMSLALLLTNGAYIHVHGSGHLVFADQVEYVITGYDPDDCALTLELVKDHRPEPAP